MYKLVRLAVCMSALMVVGGADAQEATEATPPAFDAALARKVGADEHGMRRYILVVLKTGPTRVADGPERDAMFSGHFANMNRLASEGKLALAGPFDGTDGGRGQFILATYDIEEARKIIATDPVIVNGELVAEYHKYYGSAALMLVGETHDKVASKKF